MSGVWVCDYYPDRHPPGPVFVIDDEGETHLANDWLDAARRREAVSGVMPRAAASDG